MQTFEYFLADYLDSLRYSSSTTNIIYKHRVSKTKLIEKLVELKDLDSVESVDQLKILFDETINKNTSDTNIWNWEFPLDEWECHYSHEDNNFTFEKVLGLSEIKSILDIKSKRLRDDLSKKIKSLNPYKFEDFVAKLFNNLPWIKEMKVTPYSQDGGIDFEGLFHPQGVSTPVKLLGQAKHMVSKVGGPDMRNFLGALVEHPPNSVGYFVSTGGFNPEAQERAERSSQKSQTIELYDLDRIIELIVENDIGITTSDHLLTEMDSNFWAFIDE